MTEAFEHEHRIRVRYAETDQMGVVYHANYLVYMEEARIRLMAALGFPYEEVEARGMAMIVRKAEIRYRSPVRFGDEVQIRTSVPRIGGASIVYAYRFARAGSGELLATATTEIGCVRREGTELRAAPLPEDIRQALERVVGTAERGEQARSAE